MRIAVLLMAYGGPESLEEIEPYLQQVLSRKDLPSGLVSSTRKRYAMIGGRSPLLEITRKQAGALQKMLDESPFSNGSTYRVHVGMKHWHPFIHEAVQQILEEGYDRLVGVCLAPHYSNYAVGGYFRLLKEALLSTRHGNGYSMDANLLLLDSWHLQPGFIQAWVHNIQESMQAIPDSRHENTALLFTAHSLPLRLLSADDPYPQQVEETAQAITHALGWHIGRTKVCYQSGGHGSDSWLGPNLEDEVSACVEAGFENIVAVPTGFVSDHVETLYDLDIELRKQAQDLGLNFIRVPSLNDSPLLIEALAKIILERVMEG